MSPGSKAEFTQELHNLINQFGRLQFEEGKNGIAVPSRELIDLRARVMQAVDRLALSDHEWRATNPNCRHLGGMCNCTGYEWRPYTDSVGN